MVYSMKDSDQPGIRTQNSRINSATFYQMNFLVSLLQEHILKYIIHDDQSIEDLKHEGFSTKKKDSLTQVPYVSRVIIEGQETTQHTLHLQAQAEATIQSKE